MYIAAVPIAHERNTACASLRPKNTYLHNQPVAATANVNGERQRQRQRQRALRCASLRFVLRNKSSHLPSVPSASAATDPPQLREADFLPPSPIAITNPNPVVGGTPMSCLRQPAASPGTETGTGTGPGAAPSVERLLRERGAIHPLLRVP